MNIVIQASRVDMDIASDSFTGYKVWNRHIKESVLSYFGILIDFREIGGKVYEVKRIPHPTYCQLRARRALSLFKDFANFHKTFLDQGDINMQMMFELRTRRALSLLAIYFVHKILNQNGYYCHRLCTPIVPFWFSMETLL